MNRRRNSIAAAGLAALIGIGGCFDPIRDQSGRIVGHKYNDIKTQLAIKEGVDVALVIGSVGISALGGVSGNTGIGVSSKITSMAMQQAARGMGNQTAFAWNPSTPQFVEQFACNDWQDLNGNRLADPNEFVGKGSEFHPDERISFVTRVRGGVGHRLTFCLTDLNQGSSEIKDLGVMRLPDQFSYVYYNPGFLSGGTYEAKWLIDGNTAKKNKVTVEGESHLQSVKHENRALASKLEKQTGNVELRTRPLAPRKTPAPNIANYFREPISQEEDTSGQSLVDSPVKVKLSSSIGIVPLVVSYSAALPDELRSRAYYLWTDNGAPVSNGSNGQVLLTAPGEHDFTVFVTTDCGEQYSANRRVTVLERITAGEKAK
jgi:hypothetical protein